MVLSSEGCFVSVKQTLISRNNVADISLVLNLMQHHVITYLLNGVCLLLECGELEFCFGFFLLLSFH